LRNARIESTDYIMKKLIQDNPCLGCTLLYITFLFHPNLIDELGGVISSFFPNIEFFLNPYGRRANLVTMICVCVITDRAISIFIVSIRGKDWAGLKNLCLKCLAAILMIPFVTHFFLFYIGFALGCEDSPSRIASGIGFFTISICFSYIFFNPCCFKKC